MVSLQGYLWFVVVLKGDLFGCVWRYIFGLWLEGDWWVSIICEDREDFLPALFFIHVSYY